MCKYSYADFKLVSQLSFLCSLVLWLLEHSTLSNTTITSGTFHSCWKIPWPKTSLNTRTHFFLIIILSMTDNVSMLLHSVMSVYCVCSDCEIMDFSGLQRTPSGFSVRVRDYFSSCSCCRTSLPLVRHFVRRPSHHKSLGSRLESMGVCDRSENWSKVTYSRPESLG